MWIHFGAGLINLQHVSEIRLSSQERDENEDKPIIVYFSISIQKEGGDWIDQDYTTRHERDQIYIQICNLLKPIQLSQLLMQEKPEIEKNNFFINFFKGCR